MTHFFSHRSRGRVVPRLRATIRTDRPGRYVDQLARHAEALGRRHTRHQAPEPHDGGHQAGGDHGDRPGFGHAMPKVQVVHADGTCTLTFPGLGRCSVTAGADTLAVLVEAADDAAARRIADLVEADLRRFSQRDPLSIDWYRL